MSAPFTVKTGYDGRTDKVYFLAQGYRVDGTRVRVRFDSQAQALHHAAKLNAEVSRTGILGTLSDKQRIEAERAFALCTAAGVNLTQAVTDFIARKQRLEAAAVVSVAYERFTADRKSRSPGFQNTLRSVMKPFVSAFGDRSLESVTHDDLDDFLRSQPQGATSRSNLRSYLSTFWTFCQRKNLTTSNPVALTSVIERDTPPAQPLTVEALRAVLTHAKALHA